MICSSDCERLLDHVERVALVVVEPGMREDLDHAGDADHRRADLVAHRGEERGLGAVGLLRPRLAGAQVGFEPMALGEVGGDRDQPDALALVVVQRGERQQHRYLVAVLVQQARFGRRLRQLGDSYMPLPVVRDFAARGAGSARR